MYDEECGHYSWECYGLHSHKCADCEESMDFTTCDACFEDKAAPLKYETKDSGERQDYPSGMRRDIQEGKARYDLLFLDGMPFEEQPLTRWAALLQRGVSKYGEKNYLLANSAEELARFKSSAARHFAQAMCGETDEDHYSAVFFNISMIMYLEWRLDNG